MCIHFGSPGTLCPKSMIIVNSGKIVRGGGCGRLSLFPFRKRSLPFETVVAISQNGRCHLKRSMPFFSSELHSLGLRTQKVGFF